MTRIPAAAQRALLVYDYDNTRAQPDLSGNLWSRLTFRMTAHEPDESPERALSQPGVAARR